MEEPNFCTLTGAKCRAIPLVVRLNRKTLGHRLKR